MSHARPRAETTGSLCPGGTMRNHLTTSCVIASTLALGACTEGAGSRGIAPVSLALSSAVSAAAQAGGSETFTDGTNTLVISSVEVVLRKVELKRADAAEPAGCAMSTSGITASDDGACDGDNGHGDELEAGAAPVDLPLRGIERTFTAGRPPRTLSPPPLPHPKTNSDGDAAPHDLPQAHPPLARGNLLGEC